MSNLSILTLSEQQAFDHPPVLPTEMQTVCFSINSALKKEISGSALMILFTVINVF